MGGKILVVEVYGHTGTGGDSNGALIEGRVLDDKVYYDT